MPSLWFLIALTVVLLPVAHMLLRIAPIWRDRHRGCDAYYFLLAAEDFRRRRRLPIVLPPLYLLEPEEQTYPPATAVLLGSMPERWVTRFHWLISPTTDLLSLALLTYWIGSSYGIGWAWLAAIAYAANASLVLEFSSLTSRPLGLALVPAFLLAAYVAIQGSPATYALAIFLGVALLYAHKLAVQLLWFLTPFLALTLGDPRWLIFVPASYLAAAAIAPRLFIQLLRGHWDIVTFWSRNWSLLGAHSIRQSPIYGAAATQGQTETYYRRHDWPWIVSRVRKVLDYNCFMLLLPLLAWQWGDLMRIERFALAWAAGTYIWGIATYVVRPLRCLGEGNKYFKYSLIPSLVVAVATLHRSTDAAAWILAAFCFGWTIHAYMRAVIAIGRPMANVGRATPAVMKLLDIAKAIEGARFICLPLHLSDLTAYYTRHAVLWGTHNVGFANAEPLFPVLLKPIEAFVDEYRLTHLILDESYATLGELRLNLGREVAREGNCVLWQFSTAHAMP